MQLGSLAAGRFAADLAPSGLEPGHVGLLRLLTAEPGLSQQALGERLGINATRVVFLVDDMEQRGLVERRRHPHDRRSHALHVTRDGELALARAGLLAGVQETELLAPLTAAERTQLRGLLERLAAAHGITALTLPVPARMRDEPER